MRSKNYCNRLHSYPAAFAMAVLLVFTSSLAMAKKPKVLAFCKTGKGGFQHGSIPSGVGLIFKLGKQNKFDVDVSSDPTDFNDENLKQYAAIAFVSTTGDFLPEQTEKDALKKYIEHGGGYVGIHAATDAEKGWPWYGELAGAYFKGHPTPQMATLDVVDPNTIVTKMLPAKWQRKDEWYHFYNVSKDIHVLVTLDESTITYKPNEEQLKMGADHPMIWWHDFDGGRAFYTELGHTDESYDEPLYQQHLLAGIEYAIGRKKMEPKQH